MKRAALYRVTLGIVLACSGGAVRGGEVDDSHAPGVAATGGMAGAIGKAIRGLGDDEPAVRRAASQTLTDMGREARPAVLRACQSSFPEVRLRAAEVLLRLPWYRDDDSPNVQTALRAYGQGDEAKRKEVIGQLAELTQHGFDAMARLIVEEPSDEVKWAIVGVVRVAYAEKALAPFRDLDVSGGSTQGGANAPLLAAVGHAWMPKDPARAAALLERAVAADLARPADDGGEVAAAFERMQNLALMDGRYDDVARLLRLHAKGGGVDEEGEPSRAVLDLFAAHGKYGPLAGFAQDVKTYAAHLSDPRVAFAVGKAYERDGRRLLADAAYRGAFAADVVSVADRFARGDFLTRHGWLDLAEAEYASVFALSAEHRRVDQGMTPELEEANAHFKLAQVAANREDDWNAGEHMRLAMETHYKARGQLQGTNVTDQSIWQEVNWHYLRAARAAGDKAEVAKRLESLLVAPPTNPDIANDLVPLLREMGRADEAKELFDQVHQGLLANWGSGSEHPMPKNNAAWLCARCGERKEEALRLALEATRQAPDNAAFADTLAEAYFLNGRFAEAAAVEERVVRARPGDHFLNAQLKRFRDAAAKGRRGE